VGKRIEPKRETTPCSDVSEALRQDQQDAYCFRSPELALSRMVDTFSAPHWRRRGQGGTRCRVTPKSFPDHRTENWQRIVKFRDNRSSCGSDRKKPTELRIVSYIEKSSKEEQVAAAEHALCTWLARNGSPSLFSDFRPTPLSTLHPLLVKGTNRRCVRVPNLPFPTCEL